MYQQTDFIVIVQLRLQQSVKYFLKGKRKTDILEKQRA